MSEWTSRNKIITFEGRKIGIDFRTQKGYVITPPSIHPETLSEYVFEDVDNTKSFREQIKDMPEWLNQIFVKFYEEVNKNKDKTSGKVEEERDEITNEFMINEFYNIVMSQNKITAKQMEELKEVKLTDADLKSFIMNYNVSKGVDIDNKLMNLKTEIMTKLLHKSDFDGVNFFAVRVDSLEIFIGAKTLLQDMIFGVRMVSEDIIIEVIKKTPQIMLEFVDYTTGQTVLFDAVYKRVPTFGVSKIPKVVKELIERYSVEKLQLKNVNGVDMRGFVENQYPECLKQYDEKIANSKTIRPEIKY